MVNKEHDLLCHVSVYYAIWWCWQHIWPLFPRYMKTSCTLLRSL